MATLEVVAQPSAELSVLDGPFTDEATGDEHTRFTTRFGAIFRRVTDKNGRVTWYRERA